MGLHNYRVMACLGTDKGALQASPTVVDTGAGPSLIRRDALAPACRAHVTPQPAAATLRLRDANNRRLVTSGHIVLWVQAGARLVSHGFLVVDDLSVDVILGCDFIDDHAHAILPPDQQSRWRDGSATAILRGPLDDGDRTMGVSRVLRATSKTLLPAMAATVVWVRTQWGGLGQVFSETRLFSSFGVTVANGVHDVLPGVSFPVLVTNFGRSAVVLRAKANVGYVELLKTGVVKVPDAPAAEPVGPDFCSPPAARAAVVPPLAPDPVHDVVAVVRPASPVPPPPAEPADSGGGGGSSAGEDPSTAPAGNADGDTGGSGAPPSKDPAPTAADVALPEAPPALHARIHAMLDEHSGMWTGQALGVIKTVQDRIDLTPGARPVRFAPRRAGPRARDAENAEVKRQLAADVIEPTSSEWGFPVVLVPKKDGTLRFCVDYRLLNAVTKKDSYPLPRMDECIDSLGDATVFSTLDCNAGYWQVAIDPRDREKTAFVCHAGAYHYKGMPFGLTNAPATFQPGA